MTAIAYTGSGAVTGLVEGGISIFRAVPYAAPPVGERRFAPPQPPPSWAGRRDATAHGPIAPQNPTRITAAMGDFRRPMDEDCLTLTIWTPAADAARRPVLVWLHGGAWISGAGSLDWYDAGRLAREAGIVVVGVNYRLGALGYLHLPGLTPAEGDPGTLDQVAALAWVQANIAGFGGDPGRVTLAGQSAGAASIGRLLLHPTARRQFRAAILQSGSFGRPSPSHAEAETTARAFAGLLGLDPTAADLASRLRAAPVAALLEAQTALARARARFADTNPPFMPTLPDRRTRSELLAEIAAATGDKPILIGTTREEAHAFFAANPAMAAPDPAQVAARFEALGASQGAYRRRRPAGLAMDLLADATSDDIYRRPALRLAELFAGPVFAYQFNWSPPGSRFHACHCIELPFVFGNFPAWPDAGMLAGGDEAEMQALSAHIRAAWAAFIHDGDPSLPGLAWPRYDAAHRRTMLLDRVTGVAGDPAGMERQP
jgi:para-nitrobenzyl esterase